MRSYLIPVLLCVSALFGSSQSSPKYQTATIMEVKPHHPATNADNTKGNYDVFLKVKNTVYVVLYTPEEDTGTAKYAAGRDVLILVGDKTIRFNDLLGTPMELPILSRKTVSAETKSK